MEWRKEYNIGIEVIDEQHRQIVDYISDLEALINHNSYHSEQVLEVLNSIIDYTQSHFTFEESLQQQVQYEYHIPHKCVHDMFIKKIEGYRQRFLKGESIERELHRLLFKWLISHIQHDDADYVEAVKENMVYYINQQEKKQGKGWFARFFG